MQNQLRVVNFSDEACQRLQRPRSRSRSRQVISKVDKVDELVSITSSRKDNVFVSRWQPFVDVITTEFCKFYPLNRQILITMDIEFEKLYISTEKSTISFGTVVQLFQLDFPVTQHGYLLVWDEFWISMPRKNSLRVNVYKTGLIIELNVQWRSQSYYMISIKATPFRQIDVFAVHISRS